MNKNARRGGTEGARDAGRAAFHVGRSATLLPFNDTDSRGARASDWLRFLQTLSPPQADRKAR